MEFRSIDRRMFLGNLSKGTLAVAIFGVAACGDSGETTTSGPDSTQPPATTTPTTTTPSTTTPSTTPPETTIPAETTTPATTAPSGDAGTWQRVNLGFVSAYVLARGGSAAIVDTGVPGSAGQIERSLAAVGLGWGDVDHVVLTHFHNDHVGSIGEVLAQAGGATAYAGEADIPQISSPQPLVAVGDGDEVFGLQIIHTPGHTPGHVAVLDPAGGVLVVGDALNGGDAMGGSAGEVAGPNPQFSSDMAAANETVRKLASFQFDTLFFGHGEPVPSGAAALVAALAASL